MKASAHEHPVSTVTGLLGNKLVSKNGGAADGVDPVGADQHVGLEDLSLGESDRSFITVLKNETASTRATTRSRR